MITKERLEELIEQKADIYVVMPFGVYTHRLTREYKLGEYGVGLVLYRKVSERWDYHDIFETKEDAEEYAEFGNITRTERLELPSWEIVENIIEQKKRFGLNHSDRVLARIITKDSIYYFKICKDLDLFTFELKQTYIGEDLCEQLSSKFPISLGKATKNNYDKARRLCVKLFRGEKDE